MGQPNEVGDLRRSRTFKRMREIVVDNGLVVFDGIHDAAALRRAAASVMTVALHPDSDRNGVTAIFDRADHSGSGGFTRRELLMHTDRSGVPEPPALVMITCTEGAFRGGACLLADGREVYEDLAATAPATLEMLHRARSALFGGVNGHWGAVLTPDQNRPDLRCRLRLRLDDLAMFSAELSEHLKVLRGAIDRHTMSITLAPGRGYLVDNHRWLHGRRSFTGHQVLHRVLGHPLSELQMYPGIPLLSSSPS